MTILKINRGIEVLIDNEDFKRVSKYTWTASPHRNKKEYIYRMIKINGKWTSQSLSRYIMDVTDPKLVVDYINRNPLDNRKENLRICTHRQNVQNAATREGCSSKYPGVCFNKKAKKWVASIMIHGKSHYLGLFIEERQAAKAYEQAVRELTGEELFCKMEKQ
jgi:hypothetical protein